MSHMGTMKILLLAHMMKFHLLAHLTEDLNLVELIEYLQAELYKATK